MPGKTGASNASNAAPFSHTRTCTLYMSNQTFIRLSSVSHPDCSMPCLRSFSVKFLFYILFYIMYARVWETGAALFALLALLACVSRGRLGGSKRTPASSAKWKAVPRCILWSPFFKELEKSRSAFSRLNFTDREHRAMKPSRPASPQSLAMANAKRTYSQYPGAISTPAERTASTKRDKLSDM